MGEAATRARAKAAHARFCPETCQPSECVRRWAGYGFGVTDLTRDVVRQIVGGGVSDDAAGVLLETYGNLSRAVAAFPAADLKAVEPALRSMPGPLASWPAATGPASVESAE